MSAAGPASMHHRRGGALLWLGIVLLAMGVLALLVPLFATLAATVALGALLLAAGLSALFHLRRHLGERGFWKQAAWAVVGAATGVVLIAAPAHGAVSLTLVLAVGLIVQGLAVSLYAVEHRGGARHGWAWLLASGVLSVATGLLLFVGLPATAIWTIGLVVAFNFLAYGGALVAAGLGMRRAVDL